MGTGPSRDGGDLTGFPGGIGQESLRREPSFVRIGQMLRVGCIHTGLVWIEGSHGGGFVQWKFFWAGCDGLSKGRGHAGCSTTHPVDSKGSSNAGLC